MFLVLFAFSSLSLTCVLLSGSLHSQLFIISVHLSVYLYTSSFHVSLPDCYVSRPYSPACLFRVSTPFVYPIFCLLELPSVLTTYYQTLISPLDLDFWIVFCTIACLDCFPVLGLLPVFLTVHLITFAAPFCRHSTNACLFNEPSDKDICSAKFWVAIGSSVTAPDRTIWPEMEPATLQTAEGVLHFQVQKLGQQLSCLYMPIWRAPPTPSLEPEMHTSLDPWSLLSQRCREATLSHAYLPRSIMLVSWIPFGPFSRSVLWGLGCSLKVTNVMTLLAGKACEWGTAFWDSGAPECEGFHSFSTEMKKVFDRSVVGHSQLIRFFTCNKKTAQYRTSLSSFKLWQPLLAWIMKPSMTHFYTIWLSKMNSWMELVISIRS